MKKDYIPLQNSDGELEVYFLKAKSEEPNKCVNHESPASAEEKFKEVGEALGWEAMPDDAYGLAPVVDKGTEDFCCPIGEKGEVGEVGIPAPHPLNEEHMVDQLGKPPTTEEKEAFQTKISASLSIVRVASPDTVSAFTKNSAFASTTIKLPFGIAPYLPLDLFNPSVLIIYNLLISC